MSSFLNAATGWLPAPLRKPVLFALLGGLGCLLGQLAAEPWTRLMSSDAVSQWYYKTFKGSDTSTIGVALQNLTVTPVYTAIIGVGIGLLLTIGQNLYLGRPAATARQIVLAIAGGAVAGFIGGLLAELCFQLAGGVILRSSINDTLRFWLIQSFRVVIWCSFGTIIALGLSLVVPNLRASRAMLGGLIGGILGGIAFVIVTTLAAKWFLSARSTVSAAYWVDLVGRVIGIGVLGAAIGAMIAIAEALLSSAALEVVYGPKDVRVIPLSEKPVRVGSNRELCAVYVAGGPPEMLRFRFASGQVLMDDVATGQTTPVAATFQRPVGRATLRLRGGARTGGFPTAGPTPATPPVGPSVIPAFPPIKPFAPPGVSPVAPPVTPAKPANSVRVRRADGQIVTVQFGIPVKQGHIFPGGPAPQLPLAELVRNPNDPSILGLKNIGQRDWQVTMPDGRRNAIAPGRTIRATPGTSVETDGMHFSVA